MKALCFLWKIQLILAYCIYEKKGLFACDKLKIAKEALGLMGTIEDERDTQRNMACSSFLILIKNIYAYIMSTSVLFRHERL